jgi:hypothetical protein
LVRNRIEEYLSHVPFFSLYKYLYLFVYVVSLKFPKANMAGSSRNSLAVGRVIGDVIDPFENSVPLRVTYGNREVNNGCELKPSHVANQPRVSVGGNDLRNIYTLVI